MKCSYCGEDKDVRTIMNPNMSDDQKPFWKVCKGCEEVIKDTQKKDIEMILSSQNLKEKKQ